MVLDGGWARRVLPHAGERDGGDLGEVLEGASVLKDDKIPAGERAMVARARHAMHRLVGLEKGDQLADQLWEARKARYEPKP